MEKECCNIDRTFTGFYSSLLGFAQKRVNVSSVANDIVQEVFLKLVESHKKSTEIQNMKAWIYQVTRNVLNDYYRKQQKELHLMEQFSLDSEQTNDFIDEIDNDSIVAMINTLPKKYSVPLYLSDIEELSQKEIAEKLGLGLSATKMRIQRGREKLKDLFITCCDIEYDAFGNFISCTVKPGCSSL